MHRGALWMHALVENLLCDASIREGRFHLNRKVASLPDIVAEVEPVVVPLLTRRRQRLSLPREIPVSEVVADPRRIGQVLVNFLSNASKYSPVDSDIEISLVPQGAYVRAEVLDRGPGIPKGDETRLFESFYRNAVAQTSGQVGAGLGLSIARAIVEAHAGRYGVENRVGGGACFWFELPTPAVFGASGDESEIEIGEGRR
jgi:two-component system sensor histidine kinase KdpD